MQTQFTFSLFRDITIEFKLFSHQLLPKLNKLMIIRKLGLLLRKLYTLIHKYRPIVTQKTNIHMIKYL